MAGLSTAAPSVEAFRRWRERPATMVRELFNAVPDPWQAEVLDCFPTCQRIAMKASKGPGKTALEAWLAWNFLLTRPHPKVAATSITKENLTDNLWAEMAKWQNRSELLRSQFTWTRTRIFANAHPETWWMSARTWPKAADSQRQADTLAGLHADYIFFILDESGGIPDAVMVAADAALSSCVEGHILQGGNPVMLEGPLYRAATRERSLWKVVEVNGDPDDPKRSPRISVDWARQQIARYGRDNPWVLTNVFGQFPPASINALIGPDEVSEATRRAYRAHEIGDAPRVIGVDVARYGDAASAISRRQGIQAYPIVKARNLDSIEGAGWVSRHWSEFDADACFLDTTGGFGAGWDDQLRQLNRKAVGIQFSTAATLNERYFNKRAEMYFEAVDWIKRGGALPPDHPQLSAGLTATTYTFKGDRMILEPKDAIEERLGHSLDETDAFVLTFAYPVEPRAPRYAGPVRHLTEYDPMGALLEPVRQPPGGGPRVWMPGKGYG